MAKRNLPITVVGIIVLTFFLASWPLVLDGKSSFVLAQEEIEKSGDLTQPENGLPFGGDNAGTYSIGQDRYGLRIQVDMDDPPTNGTVYVAWLIDNSTGNDLGIGQLVDDELAVTQQITNSSLYNLIEITQESPGDVTTSRNQSTTVAGAEIENESAEG